MSRLAWSTCDHGWSKPTQKESETLSSRVGSTTVYLMQGGLCPGDSWELSLPVRSGWKPVSETPRPKPCWVNDSTFCLGTLPGWPLETAPGISLS